MSYSFEDYDNFLQNFNSNNNNQNFAAYKNNDQLQGNSIVSNPSYSTSLSLSTDDEENVLSSFYDFDQLAPAQLATNPQQVVLSPHDYTSNSSNSPNDSSLLNGDFSQVQDFGFNNTIPFDVQQQQYQLQQQKQLQQFQNATKVKQESRSSSVSTSSSNSPNATISQQQQPQHKIKLANAVPHGASISKRAAKKEKSSHNMIEKRYRTNINDKIKALRDSVPALRVLVDSGDDEDNDDGLDGLQPAKKLNKATILAKATEYIRHLETKNDALKRENDDLKVKLYGGSYLSPNGSVGSSYSSNDGELFQPQQTQQAGSNGNFANKVLLGGLACMVGAGLNDDLSNVDSKSLFAVPVFGYDQSGFSLLSKPLVVLLKVGFIFGVILNFIVPSLFYSNSKKPKYQLQQQSSEDVRNLKTGSILSTFSLRPNHSNNDYIKSAIFRALSLKISFYQSNTVIRSLVEVYVDHLWTYLKNIKLDSSHKDYDVLRSILSLPNQQTIHNDDYVLQFIKSDPNVLSKGPNNEVDFSVVSILYNMIHDTTTSKTLRSFLISTINDTDKSVGEIQESLSKEIDEYNVELKTLFNPTESQINKLKKRLEDINVSQVENDELLVLYSSIIQNLVAKKDYSNVKKWFDKVDIQSIEEFQLLGFTSLYTIILTLINSKEMFELIQNDKEFIFRIEEISGSLRIWLGNSNGSVLNFKKRSQLIDYFVKISLRINGLEQGYDGSKAVEI